MCRMLHTQLQIWTRARSRITRNSEQCYAKVIISSITIIMQHSPDRTDMLSLMLLIKMFAMVIKSSRVINATSSLPQITSDPTMAWPNLGDVDKRALGSRCHHANHIVGVQQRSLRQATRIITSFIQHLINLQCTHNLVLKNMHFQQNMHPYFPLPPETSRF